MPLAYAVRVLIGAELCPLKSTQVSIDPTWLGVAADFLFFTHMCSIKRRACTISSYQSEEIKVVQPKIDYLSAIGKSRHHMFHAYRCTHPKRHCSVGCHTMYCCGLSLLQ